MVQTWTSLKRTRWKETNLKLYRVPPHRLVILAKPTCLTSSNLCSIFETEWPAHLLALATLGIASTALAMLLMNSLICYSSAVTASSVTYVIPIFAIMWGLLDHEKISLLHIICMAFILAGVYLINRMSRQRLAVKVNLKSELISD